MSVTSSKTKGWSRDQMAELAARDIPDGSYVNLGIGIPELVAKFVPEGREFIYHTENGLLGMGPTPEPGQEDPELINAGKKPVKWIGNRVKRSFTAGHENAGTADAYRVEFDRRLHRAQSPFTAPRKSLCRSELRVKEVHVERIRSAQRL